MREIDVSRRGYRRCSQLSKSGDFLIDRCGCNPNAKGTNSNTPLHQLAIVNNDGVLTTRVKLWRVAKVFLLRHTSKRNNKELRVMDQREHNIMVQLNFSFLHNDNGVVHSMLSVL